MLSWLSGKILVLQHFKLTRFLGQESYHYTTKAKILLKKLTKLVPKLSISTFKETQILLSLLISIIINSIIRLV